MPRTAFISGPLDVSHAYFEKYYKSLIDTAVAADDKFVVGSVSGIDALAFDYLLSHSVGPSRIKIYMADFEIACRPAFVKEIQQKLGPDGVVVAKTQEGEDVVTMQGRDAAMTRASEYDILRFRTEAECKKGYGPRWRARISNTERNWRRRWDGNEGEEGGEYVRHLSPDEAAKRDKGGKDGVSECDGQCWGHRDVVQQRSFFGRSATFGFGNAGARTS